MTLAEALEPLYRSYLRRLEEMAARLPPQALLTETVSRGDDGRLAASDDGLPLRFDVADARHAGGGPLDGPGARCARRVARERAVGRLRPGLLPARRSRLSLRSALGFRGGASPSRARPDRREEAARRRGLNAVG